jgi:HEAT repeat protein
VMLLVSASCATREKDQATDVAAQLKTATTASGQDQYKAIDHLGDDPESAATVVPALEKLLDDKDPQVRWRAERALGDFGDKAKEAVPELQKELTNDGANDGANKGADDDAVVDYHAAIALGKIGDKSEATVDALVTAATNPDKRVARAAIAALRRLKPGPQKVGVALEKALEDDDSAVVMFAIDAIVEHGKEASPLLIELLKRPRTSFVACAAIEQIGPDAKDTVPALVELLKESKHSQLEIQALLALGKIGAAAEPAVPTVIAVAEKSQDATVPVAAVYALGSIGTKDKAADAHLRAALAKDNAFLQMVAAWALAKTHPDDASLKQQALDKLSAGAKSDDEAIRSAAAKGLASLAPPDKPADSK